MPSLSGPRSVVVSIKRCYAGNLGSKAWMGGDHGQCLRKPWPHLVKGIKTGTSPMWDDRMAPTIRGMFKRHLILSPRDGSLFGQ